ncbi:YitT family protein [Companilactobacillus ginsenosidimutans]|uniref:YitT family protein n=1 Tax=Companilactobacillus ginsenosidimutans TaxID=1007676 RepID=UPI001E620AC8|nr:YitT family protein [Companilactobacillus ginsenosidimutans]
MAALAIFKGYPKQILAAVFYGITSAMGIQLLLQPSKIYTSGVMGASQLLVNLLDKFVHLSTEVYFWYFLLNVPLIILSWKKLGKKFTVLSLISIVSASVFILFIPLHPITNDPMLASIFGGAMVGVGSGVCFRYGFSTGGTDIIALIIQKSRGGTVGQVGFTVNAIIIVIAGMVFGWELALYSMVSIFITNIVIDRMYIQQQKITVVIYSHSIDEISKELLKTLNRGITMDYNLTGAYSGEQIGSMTMVVTKFQLFFIKQTVQKIDPNAFINIQPTIGIMGKFSDN